MNQNTITLTSSSFIVSCIISLLVGAGGAMLYYSNSGASHFMQQAVSRDEWITLQAEKDITYSTDALFKSDIKLPEITALSGKSKFVTDVAHEKPGIKLGYVVDVEVAPLDISKVPDRYKNQEDKTEGDKRALDAVDYDVVFYFILKDKDGFPLMKTESNKETIRSGTHNHFQLFAKTYIPQNVVSNTKIITLRMEAVKCVTCEDTGGKEEHRHRQYSPFHF